MATEHEIDELYRLPLAEFVVARNDLSKKLRLGGDREAAKQVKKLVKPSLTAWVVNRLAFEAPDEVKALLAAGERLREAHLSASSERQDATRERRKAISQLLERAERVLTASGNPPHRGHLQRISTTLETLSSQGADSDAPRAGRLTRDLEPQGFDAVADLAAALGQLQASRPTTTPPPVLKLVPPPPAEEPARAEKEVDAEPTPPSAEDSAESEGAEIAPELVQSRVAEVAVEESAVEESSESSEPVEPEVDEEARRLAAERAAERVAERQRVELELSEAREALAAFDAQAAGLRSLSQRARDDLAKAQSEAEELESALREAGNRAEAAEQRAREAQRLAEAARQEAEAAQRQRDEAVATRERIEQETEASAVVLRRAEQEAETARQRVSRLEARCQQLEDPES
ncbi:MAG: hypothetical protein AAF560_22945 [Acidobacteriota bacterium]